jgi:hypothetical protein
VYRLSPFTLTGENFSNVPSENIVAFGSDPVTVLTATTTEIVAMVPKDFPFGKYSVSVTVNSLTGHLENQVDVTAFVINGISPSNGPKGTSVTISGAGFGPPGTAYSVTFNGKAAEVLSSNTTEIRVKVPEGAGTGIVSVAYSGVTVIGPTFNYILSKGYEAGPMQTIISHADLGQVNDITYDSVNSRLYATGGQGIKVIDLNNSTIGDLTIVGLGAASLKDILYVAGNIYAIDNHNALKISIAGSQGSASTVYTTTCCTLDVMAHYQGTIEIAGFDTQLASSFYVTINADGTTTTAPGGGPQAFKSMAIDPVNGKHYLAFGSTLVYTLTSPSASSKVLDTQVNTVTCDLMGNGFWITPSGRISMYDPRLDIVDTLFENTDGVDLVARYQTHQVRVYLLDNRLAAVRTFIVTQVMN